MVDSDTSYPSKINQKVYQLLHHLVNMAPNFDGYGQGLIYDLEKLLYDSSPTTKRDNDE